MPNYIPKELQNSPGIKRLFFSLFKVTPFIVSLFEANLRKQYQLTVLKLTTTTVLKQWITKVIF